MSSDTTVTNTERFLAEPESAQSLPPDQIAAALADVTVAQARLAAVHAVLVVRLQAAAGGASRTSDTLLTMEAVAERLAVPVAHAREMGRRHEIPTVRVGRYIRVRSSSLRTWLQQREELGGAPARVYHPRPKRTAGASARVVPLRQPEASR